MVKKHHDKEIKNEAARKREKAAHIHKEWVELKKTELLARKAKEYAKRAAQRQKEDQVKY